MSVFQILVKTVESVMIESMPICVFVSKGMKVLTAKTVSNAVACPSSYYNHTLPHRFLYLPKPSGCTAVIKMYLLQVEFAKTTQIILSS